MPGEEIKGTSETPVKEEFQINSYTTDGQKFPGLAIKENGDFVVMWHSLGSGGTDRSDYSIQGQLYSSDGSALGAEFQVNSYTTSNQWFPEVAADSAGNFVAVWASLGSSGTDSSSHSIQGQRFSSEGSPLGLEFQINSYTTDSQFFPDVATQPNGDFVVVWNSRGSSGTDLSYRSVQGRRFASDGSPLGVEFQVNSNTFEQQIVPSVAVDSEGNFVVVWFSDDSGSTDTSFESVQGQRYSSDGSPLGTEFQVNTYTLYNQRFPTVAVDSAGGFVVVWFSSGSLGTDSSDYSIQGQRYASDGSPLGIEFQVNTYTTGRQHYPSVAVDSKGDFIVVWRSSGSGSTDLFSESIQSQRYASDGSPIGTEFQVNTYTTSNQQYPAVEVGTNGNFLAVWHSDGSSSTDTSLESIQGRFLPTCIFSDGFESGDTSSWSIVTP